MPNIDKKAFMDAVMGSIGGNLDPAMAQKLADDLAAQVTLRGGVPNLGSTVSNYRGNLDDYHLGQLIGNIGDAITPGLIQGSYVTDKATNPILDQTQAVLDPLFGKAQEAGIGEIKSQYGDLRGKLAEEQAATNRFDSPVAAIPELSLATSEGHDISSLIGNLSSARIAPTLDLYKFGANMDFEKEQNDLNRYDATRLGQLQGQAANQKPKRDAFDWASLGTQGISAAAATALPFLLL